MKSMIKYVSVIVFDFFNKHTLVFFGKGLHCVPASHQQPQFHFLEDHRNQSHHY